MVLLQTSPESASIFVLLQRMLRKQKPAKLAQCATEAGLSDEEYKVHGPIVSPNQIFICKDYSIYTVTTIFIVFISYMGYLGLLDICSGAVC